MLTDFQKTPFRHFMGERRVDSSLCRFFFPLLDLDRQVFSDLCFDHLEAVEVTLARSLVI